MYSYQNAAFAMIEKVIRASTDKSYEEWITELIFKPSRMHHASISYEGIANNENTAFPHRRGRNYTFSPDQNQP